MESYVTRSRQRFGVEFFRNLLVAAVRKAAAGEATISPNMAKSFLRFLGQGDQSIADATRLSAREIKVLWLIAEAKSTELIANILGISVKAVKSHVKNILEKLYLNDRAEAAFVWRDKMTL